jgi:hypothetical protein
MALSLVDYCDIHNLKPSSKVAQSRYGEYLNNLDLFDSAPHPKVKPSKIIASNVKAVSLEGVKVAKVTTGAKLAAMRVIEDKVCALDGCNKIITGIKKKKYCDDTCKQKAKYQRKKQSAKKQENPL